MSEENFLGIALHRQLTWGVDRAAFYPRAVDCLKLLTVGFPPKRVRFILYHRDMSEVIKGHYVEGLRALRISSDFLRFLDRLDLETFDFNKLTSAIKGAFPDSRLIVKPFAPIRDRPEDFVRDFLRTCRLDDARLKVSGGIENPSIDARQAEHLRALAESCDTAPDHQAKTKASQVYKSPPDAEFPITYPPEYLRQLQAVPVFRP